ncbi:AP-3 complex subunit delta-like [Mangifera indica]|uniref:AP-3 complex subunit delta-like n=1 Tax=Mangifera indica TaxID=29780 RepID=UPI001CFC3E52|nr:AP-3 complex subunit delta-like [Mangifera indica]
MASTSIMDTLFQRNLDDLIKGFRQHQVKESVFISKALEEIRREIKSTDLLTKSTALQKLSYLNSLHGTDMSFASFQAIEVMSSPQFLHKRIGYNAVTQSFHENTPVMLLITNQLRKDLNSHNQYEVSLALECLSRIGNIDLCRDLTPEVFTLLSSSKAFVKKKAIAVVLRIFEKYPDAVRVCFKRLVENLESSDPVIVSAVIGVFCELSSKDPRSYLPLAPEFYKILVDSKNNWLLIKVVKIFARLVQLEPRLAKRVVEPICEHMRRTGAKSLLFECVRTVVSSLNEYESAVKLAVAKVREFLVDDDPNLKFLGLQALSIIAPKHVWAVLENKDFVVKSLSDGDFNIKLESLRLLMAMVFEDNVVEITRVLVNYALKSDPEFCNKILGSILSTCSRNLYEVIVDFDWYASLLGEMARIPHCKKGEEIENQLIDIGMRVKDVRPELVSVSRDLLIDPALLGNPFLHQILSAAAWLSGEYVEFSRNPFELMEALLQPRTTLLQPSIRAVYVQSAFKVLIFCLHSYLLSKGNKTSSYPENLSAGISETISVRKCPESSDLATSESPAHYEEDEEFDPRDLNKPFKDFPIENGPATSASLANDSFTQVSIVNLLNLVELALGPLSVNHDVEIQERARNVLGLIDLIKQEVINPIGQGEGILAREETVASSVVKLMHDAFFEELDLVSSTAQSRVLVPEGLTLNENLADLEIICGDVQSPLSSAFSLGSAQYGELVGVSPSYIRSKDEPEPSNESTALLAEHRKRHGLYYLPSEKTETVSNDYPPANDPMSQDKLNNNADDLLKLTEQSLAPKKKSTHAKPRPVVLKLDGDEISIAAKKAELKGDTLSGAVRDVFLANEPVPVSSLSNQSDKPSSRRKGKEKYTNLPLESENIGAEEMRGQSNTSSRRSKHRSHGKERRHKGSGKNVEENEDNVQKEKKKSNHSHSRHKAGQKADEPLNVVTQTAVVPDFLL